MIRVNLCASVVPFLLFSVLHVHSFLLFWQVYSRSEFADIGLSDAQSCCHQSLAAFGDAIQPPLVAAQPR
jgi:hypothetical protein